MNFAIHISTKNRKNDLHLTLAQIHKLLGNFNLEVVVFDDGSNDGTSSLIQKEFPWVKLFRNEVSRGYMYCRNYMLNTTQADVAISLDDDAHFISDSPLENIANHFNQHPECGLLAFRIYWNKTAPKQTSTNETVARVKSYVGCGHAWRIAAWKQIPSYPEWFEFYGEETYASMQLFKHYWEVHYIPEVLVWHRVDLKARKAVGKDYTLRYRRGLRAGWYTIFLFYPIKKALRYFLYSLWMQLKTKVVKGQFQVILPIIGALWDLLIQIPKITKYRTAFTTKEFESYGKLKAPKIYWSPEK